MKKIRKFKATPDFPELDNFAFKKILKILQLSAFCFILSIFQVMASEGTELSFDNENEKPESISGTVDQQKTISGTIRDEKGNPLPGVSVVIKGTTQGTSTDINGQFSLAGVTDDATLVISFIGMKTQEILIGNQTKIDVVLEEEAIGLKEVVVTGYTTRAKGELTGSISTISSATIEKSSNKDLAKSLEGRVPGLIVNDRGGYPGDGEMTLLIRGKSTLNNNSPLVLIDGITAGDFSNLAPQDIESLTVLKDGAAAIYGARAANGVILITTKRGKTGKPVFNLTSSYALSTFASFPKLMSSEQHAIYENEIADRKGLAPRFTQEEIDKFAAGTDPVKYPNTNFAELTFADYSPESRTSISVTGGTDNVNYFVSGDYTNQKGIYESGALGFKQFQLRSNLDIKLRKDFNLGVDLSGRFGVNNEPGVNAGYIYKHIYADEPTQVGIYPNGLVAWGGESGANPYIMSSNESGFLKKGNNDLRGKLSFDWKLDKLTKGLSVNGFAGYRRMSSDTKSWYTPWTYYTYVEGTDEYVPSTGYTQSGPSAILRETFWKYDELMLNAVAHYDRTFNDHTIKSFVGYEQMTSQDHTFWAERKDFPSKDHPELFAGSDEGQSSSGTSNEWGRVNYFGSLSYDYMKKYFLDLTVRRDGSSNFGPGKRFGIFPQVGVSWSIADEPFLDFTNNWLDAFKIRASWAIMGNDRIGAFQYLTRYNYGSSNANAAQPNYYIFGVTGVKYNGYASANVPNPDITWETADMKNLGVNFVILKNKLSGGINYFYQKREDILITRNASIPDAVGITLPAENLGKVDNYGWEFELAWNHKIGEVGYNIGMNFTLAKNEVVYLDEAADVPELMKREGHPMDAYIVYPTFGIFHDSLQVATTTATKPGTVEGEPAYIDTDGNGIINANDRIRTFSSNIPEVQYGIFGSVSYKGFDLSFLLQGQAKAEMVVFFDQQGAKPEYVYTERWTPENRDSRYPRAFGLLDTYSGAQSVASDGNNEFADLWLHNASYLKLKEVELRYTLTKEKIKVGNLKLFVRGSNLFTMFSEVNKLGLDPEATGYDNFRLGTYTSLKSYTFGLNLTF
ncbi:MAG TPA: TonB-dependent receptor [Bacteroidales bacterium]|nr:TonB-dependent receptor [Bacteroidales bacterium]